MRRYSILLLVGALGCSQGAAELVAPPQPEAAIVIAANHTVLLQAPADPEAFRFPADKGGNLVGQLLRPSERIPGALDDTPSSRKTLLGARGLENPQVPLSAGPSELPRRALEPAAIAVRPRGLGEGTPLTAYRDNPVGPTRAALATGVPVSLPSVDVNQPAPLPALNALLADRVPLDDPSVAASRLAALAAAPPLRLNPVPFTPENLPDPFANAETVRLRQPPAENTQPRQ